MLNWILAFLLTVILAALLGFTGIVAIATWIAKAIFVLFLFLFLASLVLGRKRV